MRWTDVSVEGGRVRKDPLTHNITKSLGLDLSDAGLSRTVVVVDHDLTKSIDFELSDNLSSQDGAVGGISRTGFTEGFVATLGDGAESEVNPAVAHQVSKSLDLTVADDVLAGRDFVAVDWQISKSLNFELSDSAVSGYKPTGQHVLSKSLDLSLLDLVGSKSLRRDHGLSQSLTLTVADKATVIKTGSTHNLTKNVDLPMSDGAVGRVVPATDHLVSKNLDLSVTDGVKGTTLPDLAHQISKSLDLSVFDLPLADKAPTAHQLSKSLDLTLGDQARSGVLALSKMHHLSKSLDLGVNDGTKSNAVAVSDHALTKSLDLSLNDGHLASDQRGVEVLVEVVANQKVDQSVLIVAKYYSSVVANKNN